MIVGGLGIGGIDSVGVCPVCVTGSLSSFLFLAINDTLFLKKLLVISIIIRNTSNLCRI